MSVHEFWLCCQIYQVCVEMRIIISKHGTIKEVHVIWRKRKVVYTYNGTPKTFRKSSKNTRGTLYKIKTESGREVTVAESKSMIIWDDVKEQFLWHYMSWTFRILFIKINKIYFW